jgi:hypothetical protein
MLVAKMGQDGHNRGAKIIATAFANLCCGMSQYSPSDGSAIWDFNAPSKNAIICGVAGA